MNKSERNDPIVWMLLLERGRRTGDFELAAHAKAELERLGIRISYRRPRKRSCNATVTNSSSHVLAKRAATGSHNVLR